jgi:anti-anti-sigma regulatory factor
MSMSANALFLTIEEGRIVSLLEETRVRLESAHCEAVLDFSSVHRINPDALRALEDFARVADEKAVKIVLSGVTVDVYKVLKLVKLTHRVSFLH